MSLGAVPCCVACVFITNYYSYMLTTKQEKKKEKERVNGSYWDSRLLFDSGGMDLGLEFPVILNEFSSMLM